VPQVANAEVYDGALLHRLLQPQRVNSESASISLRLFHHIPTTFTNCASSENNWAKAFMSWELQVVVSFPEAHRYSSFDRFPNAKAVATAPVIARSSCRHCA
jgi:hypothetical protein